MMTRLELVPRVSSESPPQGLTISGLGGFGNSNSNIFQHIPTFPYAWSSCRNNLIRTCDGGFSFLLTT